MSVKIDNIDKYIEECKLKMIKLYINIIKGFNCIIDYIVKNNIILYGKSALEIYNNKKLTYPINCLHNNTDEFKELFKLIKNNFKILYKITSIKFKKTTIYNLNLINVLNITNYESEYFKESIEKINNFTVNPIISLIDIYYIYSTPIYNESNGMIL